METNLTKQVKIGSLETTYYASIEGSPTEVPQEIVENFMAFLTAVKEIKPAVVEIISITGKGVFRIII